LAKDANLPGNKPGRDNTTYGGSVNASYDVGGAILTSITSLDSLKRREYGDYDASQSVEADVYFGSHVRVLSEEARISSTGNGPFTWVAGIYYSEQNLNEQYFSDFTNNLGTYARVNYNQKVRSISGFGQVEYAVTPQLNLIGGLRYEHEKRNLNGFGSAFGGAQALKPTDVSTKMTPTTGKVGVEFKPVANVLLYASASKGVKSGGFATYNTGSASAIAPFKPETLYAYEAGFKTNFSKAIEFNGAAFYYDYRKQQVLNAICTINGPVGSLTNVKKSNIYGFEGEVKFRPTNGLTIAPYASYKHGKFKDYQQLDLGDCRANAGNTAYVAKYIAGGAIPFPKVEAGANVSYEVPVGSYTVTPSATASYRSHGFSWLGSRFDIPSYVLVNADLSFGPEKGGWNLALWGRNIFNKQYDLTRNFFTSSNIAQPGRPVSYGVRASFNY
jgi:outer membrane receptor protein involved in Fe transport